MALKKLFNYDNDADYKMQNRLDEEITKLEQYNVEYAENKAAAFPRTIPSDG
jgi:hypothetical protein